jgi:tetratricopeptide (TPR) repeat protein
MRAATRRRLLWLSGVALLGLAIALILWMPAPGQGTVSGPAPLAYVGGKTCAECHAVEWKRWRGSQHELAMQEANEQTVLGDFDDQRFSYAGTTSRFYREDGRFRVRTDGPDGRLADYDVAYVFGVTPLQQYLIALPGGRYQALSIAWDSRPRRAGGQRWFHLYPGARVDHRDVLHWTKLSQNWNSQCAECHSTDLRKGYRFAQDTFETTFTEIDVSCEACHGPGSRHVEWAEAARERGREPEGEPGLVVRFTERHSRTWEMDTRRGIAIPSRPPKTATRTEVETCGRCHARRGVLTEDYRPGRLLGQTHRPALLDEGLYYADGQMRDEVYNWGSFLQSRMYAAGVTCSDCHDAHDLKPRVSADAVCSSCHQPEKFATRRHHFHAERSKGASCVACHMRTETYMVVDPRHDHSLRVPRPDLTVALGRAAAPNACNDCHRDRSPAWAAAAVRRWYPGGRQTTPHWATAIEKGRNYGSGAAPALVALARDAASPGIVRATAVSLLGPFLDTASIPVLAEAVKDEDPLVRQGAAAVLADLDPKTRVRVGVSLLWDPVRAVRVEAVPAFADVPDALLESEQRAALDRALDDYMLAQRTNAERPESHVNVGIVCVKRGRLDEAGRAYEAALRLAPWFVPAYVNQADLMRLRGRDDEGAALLDRALAVDPGNAVVLHSLGLLRVRQKRREEGLSLLRRAALAAPSDPGLAYTYAIGLQSLGRSEEALAVLREANRRAPAARTVLATLVSLSQEKGALREARGWAQKLAAEAPGDPAAQRLVEALSSPGGPGGPSAPGQR